MVQLVEQMKANAKQLVIELETGLDSAGTVKNKAALTRARKLTSILDKQNKEFRKESVKASKEA